MAHEVLWVGKRETEAAGTEIVSLAGMNPDGSRWRVTCQQAITGTESGNWRFFVDLPGSGLTWLTVARDLFGDKYLRPDRVGTCPSSLLSLPDGPGDTADEP